MKMKKHGSGSFGPVFQDKYNEKEKRTKSIFERETT
jgi:hypothetical protein